MANTTVTVTSLTKNAAVTPTLTAIVAANTHVITPSKSFKKVVIRLINTTASTKVFTVVAGDNPPADAAGQGNLDISLTDGSTTPTEANVEIESARFVQDDGSVQVTVASGTTGFIAALQLV